MGRGVQPGRPRLGESAAVRCRLLVDGDDILCRCVQNFSAGERQAIALARALLHKKKMIVMDEPTANIDMATDDRIQALVRSALREVTVITIAHRLNTVIDFDKILVHA